MCQHECRLCGEPLETKLGVGFGMILLTAWLSWLTWFVVSHAPVIR